MIGAESETALELHCTGSNFRRYPAHRKILSNGILRANWMASNGYHKDSFRCHLYRDKVLSFISGRAEAWAPAWVLNLMENWSYQETRAH